MSLTRDITLNGIKAAITLDTQLDSFNQLKWSLNLTDTNNNVASTNGCVAIQTFKTVTEPKPVVQESKSVVQESKPVVQESKPVVQESKPVVQESKPTTDTKMVHVERISEMLKTIDEQHKKSDKIIYVCILFNYILKDALDFTKSHAKFHKTVVDKCYDMKKEGADCPVLISLANKLLTALSAPIEKPVEPVVQEVKPVVQEVKSKAEPITQNTIDDVILQLAIKDYEYYGKKWSNANQLDKDTYIEFSQNDHSQRTELMKSILAKNKLTFDDTTMLAYYNWEKTFNPPKPINRYQKMMEFVKTLRSHPVSGITLKKNFTHYLDDVESGKITWEEYYKYQHEEDRKALMESILSKKGLKFDDTIMAAYHDWEQYYNPSKPANRYQKMMEFVKTLGSK